MISSLAPELAMYLQCTLSVHHPLPPVSVEKIEVGQQGYSPIIVNYNEPDSLPSVEHSSTPNTLLSWALKYLV